MDNMEFVLRAMLKAAPTLRATLGVIISDQGLDVMRGHVRNKRI